ncbi:MAG: M20/M25/M40 family metallo-hydrolase [Chloroflexi bacterium]|nr:M20/M25/M40 family metallo-hydrolase [Chloroflexota bacterium]
MRLPLTAIAGFGVAVLLAACGTDGADVIPTPVPELPLATVEPTSTQTVEIQPTLTPTFEVPKLLPTALPFPTRTPSATRTPVPSTDAQPADSVDGERAQPLAELSERMADNAIEFLTSFTEDHSPRASGTDQEKAAAEFLAARLRGLGYDVELQSFTVDIIPRDVPFLSLTSPEDRTFRGIPFTLSGEGEVEAPLVFVERAFPDEIPESGLAGKIALIERGEITFEEKVTRVAEAGAIAAVVFNNVPGLFGGTLRNEGDIPAVSISQEDGEELLGLMEEDDILAKVRVVVETRETQNVVAQKQGTAGDGTVVVLGGHYDTVPDTPGVNDNGSGIATLMAVAEEIADKSYPFTIRIIPFGSEELGLRGSRHYLESLENDEIDSINTMFNFDALSSGPTVGIIGDASLTRIVIDLGDANGIEVSRRQGLTGGSSDHASFRSAGVPVIFFMADDFSRIHTPDDTLEFAQPELMGRHAALAIGLLDELARQQQP